MIIFVGGGGGLKHIVVLRSGRGIDPKAFVKRPRNRVERGSRLGS